MSVVYSITLNKVAHPNRSPDEKGIAGISSQTVARPAATAASPVRETFSLLRGADDHAQPTRRARGHQAGLRRRGRGRRRRCDPHSGYYRDVDGNRVRPRQLSEGFCPGDPYVAARCPVCDTVAAKTHVEGAGAASVKCDACGNAVTPFEIVHRYTVTFDDTRSVGLTLLQEAAETIAGRANHYAALPDGSHQHSILNYTPHDMLGALVRVRPFVGQLGTCPSMAMPDSHDAGDFGAFLVGAPHDYAITLEQLNTHKTDGHMDIDAVRAGAILVAPVKVHGAGSPSAR